MDVVVVRYLLVVNAILFVLLVSVKTQASDSGLPIYAAYVSENVNLECEYIKCELDALDSQTLSDIAATIADADVLKEALASSQYEVLIGNGLVNISEGTQQAELVLEITTSWRNVPIDDLVLRSITTTEQINIAAKHLLEVWAKHLEANQVLEANKIYEVLGASDYSKELKVPNEIGEFVLVQSAVYRDPLLGSISRYIHPQFGDAIVDISVYPFSQFSHIDKQQESTAQSAQIGTHAWLKVEMENELAQIQSLISQANIEHFTISEIQPAEIKYNGQAYKGLRIAVLLNPNDDPFYSTQYVFQQNDKIIKLTGNLPESMMNVLVSESLPKIVVPGESAFMQSLRGG